MKRKFLSILTALALCPGLLPGTVWADTAGRQTRTERLFLTGDSQQNEAEGWSWEADSENGIFTLTLDNVNFQVADNSAIYLALSGYLDTVSIVLKGENHIVSTNVTDNAYQGCGIYSDAGGPMPLNIKFSGGGSLTAEGAHCGIHLSANEFEIRDVTINAQSDKTNALIFSGNLAVYNSSITTNTLNTGHLTVRNSTITATVQDAPSQPGNAEILYAANGCDISDSTLTLTGPAETPLYAGLCCSSDRETNWNISDSALDIRNCQYGAHIQFGNIALDNVKGTIFCTNDNDSSIYRNAAFFANNLSAVDCGIYAQTGKNIFIYGSCAMPTELRETTVPYCLYIQDGGRFTVGASQKMTFTGNSCYIYDTAAAELVNNGTLEFAKAPTIRTSFVNNGTLKLPDTLSAEQVAAWNIGGDGILTIGSDTYTNSGQRIPTTDLDFTDGNDQGDLETDGYHWDAATNTLTLNGVSINGTVTLPDEDVKVITLGSSIIKELLPVASPQQTQLIFSGSGKLTIQERIDIGGGDHNTLTVESGADVTANGGIYIGGGAGVNGIITVKGKLTANAENGTALYTGKVIVRSGGTLEVSGDIGISANGASDGANMDFTGAFTVEENGSFTANCDDFNISIHSITNGVFTQENVKTILSVPNGYLPSGCEITVNSDGNEISIAANGAFTISRDNARYTITVLSNENGTASASVGSAKAGTKITLTATPNEGYVFDGWTSPDVSISDAGTFTMPAKNVTVTANWTPVGGNSGSGNSGGGSRGNAHTVAVERPEHGEVSVSRANAASGSTVILTVTPDAGYALDTLTVTDSWGNEILLSAQGENCYTFTMPARKVSVNATFVLQNASRDGEKDCPSRAFADLDTGAWYHAATDYVLRNGLMGGYDNGLFGPEDSLSRAQLVQILYNRAGRPAVTGGSVFADVAPGEWYADAIAWAAANGIADGYGDGRFDPDGSVTREQLAAMLWRYAGSPVVVRKELPFPDADKARGYALDALCWAVEKGLLHGKNTGNLDPNGRAARAEAAAMLMRYGEALN